MPTIDVHGRNDDVLVAPGRDGHPVTLLPLALTTQLEDEAGVFDFQLRQTDLRHWRLLLGPNVARTPLMRRRCQRVLADFAAAQGAVGLGITAVAADTLPLGSSGKLKRIVAAPGVRSPAARDLAHGASVPPATRGAR